MKMAAKMMAAMSPEDLERMQQMAAGMPGMPAGAAAGGGSGAAGGAPQAAASALPAGFDPAAGMPPGMMADMRKQMQDPKMLKMMKVGHSLAPCMHRWHNLPAVHCVCIVCTLRCGRHPPTAFAVPLLLRSLWEAGPSRTQLSAPTLAPAPPAPQNMLKGMDPEALASMMQGSGLSVTPDQARSMVDKLDAVSGEVVWAGMGVRG